MLAEAAGRDGHWRLKFAAPGAAGGSVPLDADLVAWSARTGQAMMEEAPVVPVAIGGTDEESRGMIHSLLQGMCPDGHEFAAAVARGTGLPIMGLLSANASDGGFPGTWRRAAVMLQDGSLFDARGRVPVEEFGTPFGETGPWTVRRILRSRPRCGASAPGSQHAHHREAGAGTLAGPPLAGDIIPRQDGRVSRRP